MLTYAEMVAIREELNRCIAYPEKLRLWDEKQLYNGTYVAYHTEQRVSGAGGALMCWLRAANAETEIVTVVSGSTDDFFHFFNWCLLKANRWYSVFTQEQYWQQIERDNFPEEYLNESLRAIEQVASPPKVSIDRWKDHCAGIPTEDFRKYCYQLGISDFKRSCDLDPKALNQYLFYLSLHNLQSIGEAFWGYYDGRHTAEMLKFLREQKRRLDRGEDITRPESAVMDSPPAPPAIANPSNSPQLPTASTWMLVHFFKNGSLDRPREFLDDAPFHRHLAQQYGLTEETVKKAVNRAKEQLSGSLSGGQLSPAKKNLIWVQEHFLEQQKPDLAAQVAGFLNRPPFV